LIVFDTHKRLKEEKQKVCMIVLLTKRGNQRKEEENVYGKA